MYAPEDPAAAVAKMASPTTKIVSMTVTEKGYSQDSTGDLDFNHPDIKHDLTYLGLEAPKTAIGYVVSALNKKMFRGDENSFTVMSCDNI